MKKIQKELSEKYTNKCPECLGDIREHSGFFVCENCGLVVEQVYKAPLFDLGTPTKTTPHQLSMGISETYNNTNGLGSKIFLAKGGNPTINDYSRLSPKKLQKFKRLSRYYQEPALVENGQSLLRAITIFKKIASQLQISNSLRDETIHLFKKLAKKHSSKITNHVALIAASFLLSIRNLGAKAPIRLKEAINAFSIAGYRVSNKNVLRLIRELNLAGEVRKKIRKEEDFLDRVMATIPPDAIQEIVQERYQIPLRDYKILLLKVTRTIIGNIPFRLKGGVDPYGFATSCLYFADREIARVFHKKAVFTQKSISKYTGVPEFTIRDHSHKVIRKALSYFRVKVELVINDTLPQFKRTKKIGASGGN